MHRRKYLAALLSAAALCAQPTAAQSYPDKPIRILQGFAAGGNADFIARLVGGEMAKSLGQPIVVEPAPGAGGTIAATRVATSKPDGYTLLLATGGHTVAGALYNKLPYATVDSFEMISSITFFPFLVVVRSDSPTKGIQDLVAAARGKPDTVVFGSPGIGSTEHLTGELLSSTANIKVLHVPYKGDSGSLLALLAGEVHFVVAAAAAVAPHVKSGKLRVIATTGAARWSGLPGIPTVSEQGLAGFDVRSWAGLLAPKGTPREPVDRLNAAVRKALADANVRTHLEAIGGEVRAGSPEELKTWMREQLGRWTRVIAEAGIPKQ